MRCERCGFHNLPGTATCVSCRSPLGATRAPATAAAVTPPRRAPWRKTFDRIRGRGGLDPARFERGVEAQQPGMREVTARVSLGLGGMALPLKPPKSAPCDERRVGQSAATWVVAPVTSITHTRFVAIAFLGRVLPQADDQDFAGLQIVAQVQQCVGALGGDGQLRKDEETRSL